MLLRDKVAILAGVGPGLGRGLALRFAQHGATLVLGARTAPRLAAVSAEVAALGARVRHRPTDITDGAQCAALVQEALDAFGRVDVLVNNAAAPDPGARFADVDLEAWRATMETTLFGSLQMTAAVIPTLRAQGRGAIVFVNSMIIRKPRAALGGYASAKGALLAAAQVLARELGPVGVRVNSVVPGWVDGPSVDAALARAARRGGPSAAARRDAIVAELPLGELVSGAACADVAAFLASDLAAVVTGQALDVNAGEVCR